ncbi:MAG: DUF927 domain-containing protein [Anaerolineae bacterium]
MNTQNGINPPAPSSTSMQTAIVEAQGGDGEAPYRVLGELATLRGNALRDIKQAFKQALGEKLNLNELGAAIKDKRAEQDQKDAAVDAGSYFATHGQAGTPMLFWRKPSADGAVNVLLAQFVPVIVGERLRHRANGESLRVFTVQLRLPRGERIMELVAEQVADDRAFYTACINLAGGDLLLGTLAAKKHLAEAAKALADPNRPRSEVYEYTGWQERDGQLIYLATGGAIGTGDDIAVDLSILAAGTGVPHLANFGPRDEGDAALSQALTALGGPVRGCYPDLVTLPGLAAVFLAPLLHFSPTPDRPGLHYIGTTGVRKSALLALLQAFYGLHEPALSWRGTANSIEIALSSLRDALVTVDDLKAGTSDRGAAVKILQSYADRRGRSRATRTGELAQARFVGGLLVSAGEDIPSGEASVAARSLFIPLGANDARLEVLSNAQALAATLPTLTARYLAWIIEQGDSIRQKMALIFGEARGRYRTLMASRKGLNDAGRVATNCALLETGTAIACEWLHSVGWSKHQAQEWLAATRGALQELAYQQAEAIGDESAALAFLRGLRALLDSRRAEVAMAEEGKALPDLAGCAPAALGAVMIGWRQGDVLLLHPDLVMAEVKQWQSRQGQRVDVTKRGLYAQLRDGGWLAALGAGGKTEVVKWIGGRSQRVLALREAALSDGDTVLEEEVNF